MATQKPPTLSVDDVIALAERLGVAGNTTRRIDWAELQGDLRLAARLLLTLVHSGEIHRVIELTD